MTVEQELIRLNNNLSDITSQFKGIYQQHESARTTMINDVNAFISSFAYRTATTLEVGAGKPYATINAALDVIRDKVLITPVLIKVADGIYDFTDVSLHNHPFAHQIKIEGNVANPANCVIRWKADSNGYSHGFIIDNCRGLNISGFKLIGSCTESNLTHRSLLLSKSQLFTDNASFIVDGGYNGIAVNNGYISASGLVINNVPNAAVFAINSDINIPSAKIIGTKNQTTLPARVGGSVVFSKSIWVNNNTTCYANNAAISGTKYGVLGERGSYIELDNTQITDCSFGTVANLNATASGKITVSGGEYGFISDNGSVMQLTDAIATGCAAAGFRAAVGSVLFANGGAAKNCGAGYQSLFGSTIYAPSTNVNSTNNTVKYDVDANSKLIWS